uniref:Winged helix-turn-helix domain-containing protein n=1 Tax=Anopheles stephensi TaxID=30069 RepID=A0A182YK40_ANOST
MLSPTVKRMERPPPPPTPPKPDRSQQQLGSKAQQASTEPGVVPVPSQTPDEEQVVMTPLGKTNTSTVLLIERKLIQAVGERTHVAGGDHRGIIINKTAEEQSNRQREPAQLSLEFRVFLVSANSGQHSQESRRIKFWFRPWLTSEDVQAQVAQDFFRELVSPKEFPRDYVGFIKKIMKLLQKGYNEIQAIEIELRILEQTSAPPSRPLSFEDEQFEVVPLTPEKILELIEQAYPNPITPEDLAKDYGWEEEEVLAIMLVLKERGLIKSMEYNSFTRIHHDDQAIKIVKQMPTIASNKQPTIAIITAQYCEKLAVDAMLENKETFVRYTTVGESNVYTLGNIGAHRIVSTKLPSVGSTREAMTAAGNTTTRLLGTFQKVDYVFIVGVAGGIPHYTDYRRHVRLGDVVIAAAPSAQDATNATNGESNVYTLGNIGAHRIVSTKLPSVGSTREAMTAAGNTTTRLLGTFQKVDYVFIVGVAGGIPHYTDYRRHVRLGDVVIAAAPSAQDATNATNGNAPKPYCYVYSSSGSNNNNGPSEVKRYYPADDCLQTIGRTLVQNDDGKKPWLQYVQEGLQQLSGRGGHAEHDFARPAPNTDKLYMNIGNKNVIEVAHPIAQLDGQDGGGDDTDAAGAPQTRLHAGPIGSGYELVRSDSARTDYAQAYHLLATDSEMNSVLDSVVGNCRDAFILVKGIADYKDGTTSRKWQNYASLAAAAVMKTIVCAMDAPTNV